MIAYSNECFKTWVEGQAIVRRDKEAKEESSKGG
jgi:hypothetical protein